MKNEQISPLIYFLDDEPSFCSIFQEYMSNFGYETHVFSEYEAAVAQVQIQVPDVMCIDYRLRGITGDEFVKYVPDSVIKILITGELNYENAPLFDAHLNKPFRLKELKNLIDDKFDSLNQ